MKLSTLPPPPSRRRSLVQLLGVRGGAWSGTHWANLALTLLGGILVALFCKGNHDISLGRIITFTAGAVALSVPYFLASWVVLRAKPARSTLVIGLIFAAAFRIITLEAHTGLSTDLYRYIWDGRMQAAGINPYRYVPADPALEKYQDRRIYPHINRKEYAVTIYPPVAQMVFLAATRISESPRWMRAVMLLAEAAGIFLMIRLLVAFGLPAQRVILYAWHPLVTREFASGGHVDALMIPLLALAFLMHRRGRAGATAAAVAGAALVKLYPVVLLPALYRRWRYHWKMPVVFVTVCVAAYLPYWLTYNITGTLGFLPGYANEEGLQSGDRYYLLSLLPSEWILPSGVHVRTVFSALALLALSGAAAWAFWKPDTDSRSVLRRCLCLATIFTAVLSSSYPWYYSWLVAFIAFLPYPWLFWFTTAPMALYLNWYYTESTDIYLQNSFIYLPAAFLGLFAWARGGFRFGAMKASESTINATRG